jgi:hypothetical protein
MDSFTEIATFGKGFLAGPFSEMAWVVANAPILDLCLFNSEHSGYRRAQNRRN